MILFDSYTACEEAINEAIKAGRLSDQRKYCPAFWEGKGFFPVAHGKSEDLDGYWVEVLPACFIDLTLFV